MILGPTTASKILARMQDTEKEFLNDLFEANGEAVHAFTRRLSASEV